MGQQNLFRMYLHKRKLFVVLYGCLHERALGLNGVCSAGHVKPGAVGAQWQAHTRPFVAFPIPKASLLGDGQDTHRTGCWEIGLSQCRAQTGVGRNWMTASPPHLADCLSL